MFFNLVIKREHTTLLWKDYFCRQRRHSSIPESNKHCPRAQSQLQARPRYLGNSLSCPACSGKTTNRTLQWHDLKASLRIPSLPSSTDIYRPTSHRTHLKSGTPCHDVLKGFKTAPANLCGQVVESWDLMQNVQTDGWNASRNTLNPDVFTFFSYCVLTCLGRL